MSTATKLRIENGMLAVIIGILAFFASLNACAQDLGSVDLGGFPIMPILVASAIVSGVVLASRMLLPHWLAPETATDASKAICMGIAVAAGITTGLFGIAGNVGTGTVGQVSAGFLAACVATFGRDFLTRGWRSVRSDPS